MGEFQAHVDAVLNSEELEKKLKDIENRKVKIDVELAKDSTRNLAANIEKGLKQTKVDTSSLSKQLADSFNITDKVVIKKMKRQLDSMMNDLAATWDGKKLDFGKASGFYSGMDDLANTVLKNAKELKSATGIYDEFFNYFKGKKIYISDDLKRAFSGDEYKELLKNNVGKITKDIKKGISIDSLWPEMTQLFPEHFSQDIVNQVDQIKRAFEVLKQARADVDKLVPFNQLSGMELKDASTSVYDSVIGASQKLSAELQKNIAMATEQSKNTFDIDIAINTDKIASDIRSALQKATGSLDDAVDIHLNMNDTEIASQIRSAINKVTSGDEPVNVDVNVNRQSLQADIEKALTDIDLPIHFKIDAAELEADIRKAVDNIIDIEIDLRVNSDGLRREVDNSLDTGSADNLQRMLDGINTAGVKGQSVFQKFGISLREAFATYSLANMLQDSIYKIVDVGRDAVSTVKELNDVNMNLQMATGMSKTEVDGLITGYNELGKELADTTQSISQSADIFLRQGRSIQETNQLIEDSLVLSKVSQMDSEKSSEVLTATLNGFKMAASEASRVNDILSSIDLNSASSAQGIGTALTKTAAMANTAGMSLEKTAAIIATMKDVTQDADENIGTAVKSMLSRMNQIRAGKFVDAETGEALNDVEKVLNKVGISMRDANDQFLQSETIIDNVAQSWQSFDSKTKKAVATAMAGTYQYNKLISALDNYDKVLKLTDIAKNSDGTALKKFEDSYLTSLQAKVNSLKASLQSLAMTTISDNMLGDVLDLTKGMVNLVDETGILKGAIASLGVTGGLFAFSKISGWIKSATQEFSNLNAAMNLLKSGNITDDVFGKLMIYTEGLSKSQTKLILSSTALSDVQKIAILMNQGMSEAEAKATLATIGLATAEGTATGATITLSGSLKGLWATLMANQLILVAAGVAAVATAISKYNQDQEELRQSAASAAQSFEEQGQAIDNYKQKVEELRTELDSGNLTEEEAYNAKSELLSIQQELAESYGLEAQGLDLVNGKLEEQIGLIGQLSQADASRYLSENQKAIEKATKKMEATKNYNLGSYNISSARTEADVQAIKQIEEIAKSFESKGITLSDNGTGLGEVTISFNGDASEAYEVIDEFQAEIREVQSQYKNQPLFDSILGDSSKALNKANDILDKYKDIYDQANIARVVDNDAANELYSKYADAIEAYNNALAGGDSAAINTAKADIDSLQTSVDDFINSTEGFAPAFDALGETINKSAEATYNFKNALATDELKQYTDALQGLSDVDLKDAFATEGVQAGEDALNNLLDAAIKVGYVSGNTEDDVDKLISLLAELGYVSDSTAFLVEGVADAVDLLSAAQTSTDSFISQFNSINEILSGQSTGKSISLEDYSTEGLEDYQSAIEYVNGAMQINKEKADAITKAKQEETLAIIAAGKAQEQTEYFENSKQIDALRDSLKNLDYTSQDYIDTQQQIESLTASNNAISNQCMQFDLMTASIKEATNAYSKWQQAQSAPESGDMFDDSLSMINSIRDVTDASRESDDFMKTGTEKYKTAVDFVVPEEIDETDRKAVDKYLDSINKYFLKNDNGDVDGLDVGRFLSESVKAGLMTEENGNYLVTEGKKMEDFANSLNLSLPMIQAFFGELGEYDFDFDWNDEAFTSIGDAMMQNQQAIRDVEQEIDNLNAKKANGDAVDDSEYQQLQDTLSGLNAQKEELVETARLNIEANIDIDKQIEAAEKKVDELKAKAEAEGASAEIKVQYEEAQNQLADLQSQKDELSEPTSIEIGVVIDDIDAQIANEREKLKNLESQKVNIIGDTSQIDGQIEQSLQKIADLNNQKLEFQAYANTSEATSSIDDVDSSQIEDKEFDVTAIDKATATLNRIKNYLNSIPNSKTTTVTTIQKTVKQGSGSVSGTAHASGTAKASGDWGLKGSRKVLIGEIGREIVVNPNTGKWRTYGDNGPEFATLPNNAIIFNNAQSEELLKRGFVNSRATAMARGTAMVTGGGSWDMSVWNGYASTRNSSASSSASTKANTKAVSANTKSVDDLKEKFDSYTDWIAKFIDAFDRQYAQMERMANDLQDSYSQQNATINQMISLTQKFQSNYEKMYDEYMNKAYASGLSPSYQKKVIDGAINIESITDESLKEKIGEFEKWYSAAADLQDKIQELNVTLKELYNQKLENIEDDYSRVIDYYDAMTDRYKGIIEMREAIGKNADGRIIEPFTTALGGTNFEPYYNSMMSNTITKLDLLYKQYNEMNAELTRMVKNGQIRAYSDDWYEWQTKLQEIFQSIDDAKTQYAEIRDELRAYHWKGFNANIDTLDYNIKELQDVLDHLNSNNFVDELGNITEEGDANISLIATVLDKYKQKLADYTTAVKKLDEELKNGVINQEQYTEYVREYLDAIRETSGAIDDYKNQLIDLYKQQIEIENDTLQKNISLRKEALQKKKDYYDYDKTIRDKNKDINALKSQIAAMEGVTSTSGKAELARLKAQLAEAEDDLNSTKIDHQFEMMSTGYDELSDKADEAYDAVLDSLTRSTEEQERVINEMLERIKTSYKEAYTEIAQTVTDAGILLTEDTQKAIDSIGTSSGAASTSDKAQTANSDVSSSSTANNVKTSIDSSAKTDKNAVTSISLNKSSATIAVGGSVKLTASIRPAGTTNPVSWSSNNTGIATVSGGTVTGKKAGTAKITATCGGKSATCTVTVKAATTSSGGSSSASNSNLKTATNTTDGHNLRDAAGYSGKIIASMPKGSKVTLLGDKKEADGLTWYKVKYGNKTGWTSSYYLKFAKGVKDLKKRVLALTNEEGPEMVISPLNGQVLYPYEDGIMMNLNKGDSVIKKDFADNVMDVGKIGVDGLVAKTVANVKNLSTSGGNEYNFGDYKVEIYPTQKLDRQEMKKIGEYCYEDWFTRAKNDQRAAGFKHR